MGGFKVCAVLDVDALKPDTKETYKTFFLINSYMSYVKWFAWAYIFLQKAKYQNFNVFIPSH